MAQQEKSAESIFTKESKKNLLFFSLSYLKPSQDAVSGRKTSFHRQKRVIE